MNRRRLLSLGAVGLVGIVATAAQSVDVKTSSAAIQPPTSFDIVAAGSTVPGWTPKASDWAQGDREPITIDLGPQAASLGPGGRLKVRVAARNASPELPAMVELRISDPVDQTGLQTTQGTRVELFDQLLISVSENGKPLLTEVPGNDPDALVIAWPDAWPPGEVHLLDVTFAIPSSLDNRWQMASTTVQFHFDALSR